MHGSKYQVLLVLKQASYVGGFVTTIVADFIRTLTIERGGVQLDVPTALTLERNRPMTGASQG